MAAMASCYVAGFTQPALRITARSRFAAPISSPHALRRCAQHASGIQAPAHSLRARRRRAERFCASLSASHVDDAAQQQPAVLWHVPWRWPRILSVLACSAFAFLLAGNVAALRLCRLLAVAPGSAAHALCTDLTALAAVLTVLWLSLRPFAPLPSGWFRLRWPLPPATRRQLALCFCAFPALSLLSALTQHSHLAEAAGGSAWAASPGQEGSFTSQALYLLLLTAVAPLWEEALFRGFLLPSLTRYLPSSAAIAASALAFAAAHGSGHTLLPLTALGGLLGWLFVESEGDLGAAVCCHAAWNAWAFAEVLLFP